MSSKSFVTEQLVQHLELLHRHHRIQVTGIGGATENLTSQSLVSFGITSACSHKAKLLKALWGIEVIMLHRITTKIPAFPPVFNPKWKHLHGLDLADPECGVPGPIDTRFGAHAFSCIISHGQRSGPAGSTAAFESSFYWIVTGSIQSKLTQEQVMVFFPHTLATSCCRSSGKWKIMICRNPFSQQMSEQLWIIFMWTTREARMESTSFLYKWKITQHHWVSHYQMTFVGSSS